MEDITKHRQVIAENIAKAFGEDIEKAHKEGDIHPNGKWYWKSSANGGKGDWRVIRNKKGTTGNASADNAGKTNTKSSSTPQSSENNKSANTVTHDINGTKVTVTKNSDGSYTLEANGKKVKSDDPSYYVFGTNLKPRIKRALAQEVGLETKKKGGIPDESEVKTMMQWMSKKNGSNWTVEDRDKAVEFMSRVPSKFKSSNRNIINALNATLKNLYIEHNK